MVVIKNGAEIADAWTVLADGEDLPAGGRVVLMKARFLAEREVVLRRNAPVGLKLVAGEDFAGLEADIGRFELVTLVFPKYTDGRPYSLARLLRERFHFRGEVRASGNVLRDQLRFMLRAGFDAFESDDPRTIAALKAGALGPVRHAYQPASEVEARAPGPAWRRVVG